MNEREPDAGNGGAGAPPDTTESNRAPDLTREYSNGEITVRWYAKRCIHSAACIQRAPAVFDPRRRPWIDLEQADVQRIIKAVEACPTGALEYSTPSQSEVPANPTQVRVVPGGPLFVRGALKIKTEDGTMRETTRAAFCRCGKSKNQPFCDNSHRAQ
jgi:uncharacterized Fe-S cluster protein YjdI